MTESEDYQVGYRRPPMNTRFEKGKSGNPSGRPKGLRSVAAVIQAAVSQQVMVNQNGRRRSITLLEAAVAQQANKAAGGDRHATKLILQLLQGAEAQEEARAGATPRDPEERRASDAAFMEMVRIAAKGVVPEGPHETGA